MKYEVGHELMSEGYVMRTDALGKLQFGTLANILERYTEARYWPKILNRLFAEGSYYAACGSTFDLIAWKWKEPNANQITWNNFIEKAEAGRSPVWVTSEGMYSLNEVESNSILA